MKAIVFDDENVIAVVDGEHIHSVNERYTELYIPKDETTAAMLKGLYDLTLLGGTVTFQPNFKLSTGEYVYVAVKTEYIDIRFEEQ